MKLCGDVITVFGARFDAESGGDVWVPVVIPGCSWHAADGCAVEARRGGLAAAYRVRVRIPAEAVPDGLVIRNGDIVVRGDASGMEDPDPAALKRDFPDCAVVLGVTDNRRAPRAPHIRLTGG